MTCRVCWREIENQPAARRQHRLSIHHRSWKYFAMSLPWADSKARSKARYAEHWRADFEDGSQESDLPADLQKQLKPHPRGPELVLKQNKIRGGRRRTKRKISPGLQQPREGPRWRSQTPPPSPGGSGGGGGEYERAVTSLFQIACSELRAAY